MIALLSIRAAISRIAKALEDANELERHRHQLEFAPVGDKPPIKKAVFSHPTAEDWNRRNAGYPVEEK